jgi:acyl-CoA reductase-like NAD-dependent aldehyde dehydrogenase
MNSDVPATLPVVAPFIEGVFLPSASDETVELINPSNGQRCPSIPAGSVEDVDRAVAAARRAFDDGRWSEAAPSFRKKTLHRFADLIAAESGALDVMDASEMGKPVAEPFANAAAAAGLMRFYAEAIDKVTGDVYNSDRYSFVTLRRVPRGVIAAVVPWNFPTYVAVLKVAPALAAGNCVVLKPSELSSRSAVRLAELALQAGLPPSVLNVVPGRGEIVGKALGLHADVDMMSFTGSTAVGKRMMQYAGQSNLKKVIVECGGKSPQIVFDDGVDLDAAAASIAGFILANQGQICSVGSRLLVQKSIEAAMIEKVAARFKGIVMGDARDPKTTFGPLVSAQQRDRVMSYIESASADGAQCVAGGRKAMLNSGGFFVEPTLFQSVAPTARIAQEEIFGPVLSVTSFQDEGEAIRIANGTVYGLGAYVWTANLSTGIRMAKGIRSSVRVSAVAPKGEAAGYAASSEPAGQSGFGAETGLAGMESYMRTQRVWFHHA